MREKYTKNGNCLSEISICSPLDKEQIKIKCGFLSRIDQLQKFFESALKFGAGMFSILIDLDFGEYV